MAYQFTFEPLAASWPLLVQGASLTLALTAVSATAGLAVGILGAVSREWRLPFLHPIYTVYVECVRNTPFIVQLYFIYFGLPALGVRLNGWEASVLAMVVNLGAYSTEIIRAGVAAVPRGLIEAADSLAMTRWQCLFHVILRPALKTVWPAYAARLLLSCSGLRSVRRSPPKS